jgi:hypothetical protein
VGYRSSDVGDRGQVKVYVTNVAETDRLIPRPPPRSRHTIRRRMDALWLPFLSTQETLLPVGSLREMPDVLSEEY